MKLTLLLGGAVGYVLGAKAGRERYEEIVRVARRFGGSQTVQATAGVLQAQVDTATRRVRDLIAAKVSSGPRDVTRANGHHR